MNRFDATSAMRIRLSNMVPKSKQWICIKYKNTVFIFNVVFRLYFKTKKKLYNIFILQFLNSFCS